MRFDSLRYSSVWEDIDLLYRGLSIGPGDDVLSITSAGDNVLGLLLEEPRTVTAIDLNPCQTAVLTLKLAAIRSLDYERFIGLIGVRPHADRWGLYQACRDHLQPADRAFWDEERPAIEAGIDGAGRLDRYLAAWHDAVLHKYMSPDRVAAAFELDDLDEQQRLYRDHFENEAFERGFTWYFGEEMMGRSGRDPAQFAHVEEDAGAHFLRRFRYAFTQLPLRGNFYLERFMTGTTASLERAHPYLQPANFDRLRHLTDRVRPVTDELEAFAGRCEPGALSKANLSDIFEYASPGHTARLFEALHRVFRPGGRIAYWSLLVDRSRPADLDPLFVSDAAEADALWRRDRSWFYRSFHLEEVREAAGA
jgi:S-adenosylmethionine-diacylglycerol 3-amino-3-carboxypropyl transferase